MHPFKKISGSFVIIFLQLVAPLSSKQLFFDASLSQTSVSTYHPDNRAATGGAFGAFNQLKNALTACTPGDTLYIRQGIFSTTFTFNISGTEAAPVVISGFKNETVKITGIDISPAIDLSNAKYLVIQNLSVDSVRRWLFAANTHHCIIRNNSFRNALDDGGSSKTGLFFEEATYNRIEDNIIDNSTQDNLALHRSDHNLVIRNTITNAAHTVWVIKCGNFNIIRENYFRNPVQKIGEIYDCHEAGSEHQFFIYDSTRHNVVESNIFGGAVKYYSTSGGNGIQYAGQMGIVRRNVFYDCNAGVCMQLYESEAEHNKYNRIYNNVFYKNECGGIAVSGAGDRDIKDNRFINNALYNNYSCEKRGAGQVVFRDGPLTESLFANNCMFSPDGDNIISELFESDTTLDYFEKTLPSWFHGNIRAEPMFVDAEKHDFNLREQSPLINAGAFLTTTTRSGSGTDVPVADALFFCDGFGIEGVSGDTICIAGSTEKYLVVKVDYGNNVLTLDRSIAWEADAGVALAFTGERPDIGAFEYSAPGSVKSPEKEKQSFLRYAGVSDGKLQIYNLKGERMDVVRNGRITSGKWKGGGLHGVFLLKAGKIVRKVLR